MHTRPAELPFVPDKWDDRRLTNRIPSHQLPAIDQLNPANQPTNQKHTHAQTRAHLRNHTHTRASNRKHVHPRIHACNQRCSICYAVVAPFLQAALGHTTDHDLAILRLRNSNTCVTLLQPLMPLNHFSSGISGASCTCMGAAMLMVLIA